MNRLAAPAALLFALLMNAGANLLIKAAMSRPAPQGDSLTARLAGYLSPIYLLALVLFGLNLLAYSWSLRSLKISIAYPVMVGGGFVIILLVGGLVFGERLAVWQYAGVCLILLGIFLVVR